MKSFIRGITNLAKRAAARWLAAPIHWLLGDGMAPCGVLMYHRLAEPVPNEAEPTYNVPPETFAAQLEGLLACGYEPLSLRELLYLQRTGQEVPTRSFVVTFDDCYDHVYDIAFPVLRRLEIPATLFLSTAYLDSDQPFPFDDWTASGKPEVPRSSWLPITTEHCREMQASGLIELGAHTHSHQDFRGRPDEFRADIERNVMELRQRFGVERPTFAFPYGTVELGYTSPDLVAQAAAAGVVCCMTTDRHAVTRDTGPFQLGRFIVQEYDSPVSLQLKLSGWYSLARQIWQGVKSACMPWRASWWPGNSKPAPSLNASTCPVHPRKSAGHAVP